jgi:hypothetical protein
MSLFSSGIGVDISDHHIRLAWVSHTGTPKGLYELSLTPGLIVDDKIVKPKHLKKEMVALFAKSQLDQLTIPKVILLPESRLFSTSFQLSREVKGEDLTLTAKKIGQRSIPIPFNQTFVDVAQGATIGDQIRTGVFAVQKSILEPLIDIFSHEQRPLVAVEGNNLAVFRLYQQFYNGPKQRLAENDLVMIVDVGHRWTNITLYDKIGLLIFSRSIALRKLSDTSRGISKKLTAEAIAHVCSVMKETLEYFQSQGNVVKLAIVAGVEGEQKEIYQACAKDLKPFPVVRVGEAVTVPDASPTDVHVFGAAIGAGLRASRARHYAARHNFLRSISNS